jgi:NADH dehydrogenase
VAAAVKKRLAGRTDVGHFVYWDKGSMATIGRNSAVAVAGWLKFTGFIAWLAWLFVHIMNLIGFRNRMVVLVQWAWAYFSYQRAIRLITGEGAEESRRRAL